MAAETNVSNCRWFKYLVGREGREKWQVLMDYYESQSLDSKIVVALEVGVKERNYAVFRSYAELFKCIINSPELDRKMHEICLGYRPQKPRFDIDIKLKDLEEELDKDISHKELSQYGLMFRDLVIRSAINVLAKDGINIDLEENFLICNSNSKEKVSYHVIVHGYFHGDHLEAEAFYDEVALEAEVLNPGVNFRRWCDPGIYSKNHALRLLYNHKINESRTKMPEKTFVFEGREYTHRLGMTPRTERHERQIIFSHSLITFVDGCYVLPLYHKEEVKKYEIDPEVMPPNTLNQIVDMLKDKEMPFEITEIKGPLICMQRLESSYCGVCERVHDKVSPFAIITPMGKVKLHCRQAPKRQYTDLGELSGGKFEDVIVKKIESTHLKLVDRLRSKGIHTSIELDTELDTKWEGPTLRDQPWQGTKKLEQKTHQPKATVATDSVFELEDEESEGEDNTGVIVELRRKLNSSPIGRSKTPPVPVMDRKDMLKVFAKKHKNPGKTNLDCLKEAPPAMTRKQKEKQTKSYDDYPTKPATSGKPPTTTFEFDYIPSPKSCAEGGIGYGNTITLYTKAMRG